MPARDLLLDAAEALAAWKPDLASVEHAPLIRETAAAFRPKHRKDALTAASALSGLVYWAEHTGRPVDPDALLSPEVIESYVAGALRHAAVATQQTQRSVLNRIDKGRRGLPVGQRVARPRPNTDGPYTTDEVHALLLWAQNQPSPARRHALLALLVLGLGAGLGPSDIAVVLGTDVTKDPATGTVVVNVRRDAAAGSHSARRVAVLAGYEADALALARAAGTGWIVNPSVDPTVDDSGSLIKSQVKTAQPAHDAPPFLQARCRATWVCHHLAVGTRIDVLTAHGGYKNPSAPALYARFIDPPDTAEALRQLRGPS